MTDFLQIVVKTTERCNINCDYCYMFNRGNEDFNHRPPYMNRETFGHIFRFIEQGLADIGAKRVSFVLHGGEPLMMGRQRFDELCAGVRAAVGNSAPLTLGVQTNAMLVDDPWIDLFSKHQVRVGVSIDGNKRFHDIHRVDHRGRGTYDRTAAGVRRMQLRSKNGDLSRPGAICVISPEYSGAEIYRHLVDELGFTNLAFNFPMETHDTLRQADVDVYGKFLIDAFDEWTRDDNPKIRVRFFNDIMLFFAGNQYAAQRFSMGLESHLLIVVGSDGELSEDDPFKILNFAQRGGNVRTTSMKQFAESQLMTYVRGLPRHLPVACRECCWQNYCLGGAQEALLISRYSQQNGFRNASVFCKALKALYAHVAAYLIRNGLPYSFLERQLDYADRPEERLADIPAIPPELLKPLGDAMA